MLHTGSLVILNDPSMWYFVGLPTCIEMKDCLWIAMLDTCTKHFYVRGEYILHSCEVSVFQNVNVMPITAVVSQYWLTSLWGKQWGVPMATGTLSAGQQERQWTGAINRLYSERLCRRPCQINVGMYFLFVLLCKYHVNIGPATPHHTSNSSPSQSFGSKFTFYGVPAIPEITCLLKICIMWHICYVIGGNEKDVAGLYYHSSLEPHMIAREHGHTKHIHYACHIFLRVTLWQSPPRWGPL